MSRKARPRWGRRFEITAWHSTGSWDSVRLTDLSYARALLHRHFGPDALRCFLARDLGYTDLFLKNDHEVVGLTAALIVSGRARLLAEPQEISKGAGGPLAAAPQKALFLPPREAKPVVKEAPPPDPIPKVPAEAASMQAATLLAAAQSGSVLCEP